MKMKSLPLILLPMTLAAACSTPSESPQEPPAAAATQPAKPAPREEPAPAPAQKPRNVFINSVKAGNPLVVKGRARTFENNVVIRVLSGGALIEETSTTSLGEMGQYNPYTAEVWLTRDPGKEITVEAVEYSARDGSVSSLDAQTVKYRVEPVTAELYFPAGDCTRIRKYERRMPKSVAMARLLVEALIEGPTSEEKQAGANAVFPREARVRGVNLRDGVLTVDFNERLQNVGGSCAAQAIRESVTKTLRALPTVRRVVITAGGREDIALQP